MERPTWLDGTFADAMRVVAERATVSRSVGGLTKHAALEGLTGLATGLWDKAKATADQVGLSDALSNEHVRKALMGGAAGAGVGLAGGAAMEGEGAHHLRNAALGGLGGAALGGLGSLALSGKNISLEAEAAAQQASEARKTLGLLGVDDRAVNQAVNKVHAGGSPALAWHNVRRHTPGPIQKLKNAVPATTMAASQGDVGEAARQADVLGLKYAIPGNKYFSPGTLLSSGGLAAGAHLAHRGIISIPRILQHLATSAHVRPELQDILQQAGSRGGFQNMAKRMGRSRSTPYMAAAAMLPLIAREWMPGGHRSGRPAFQELMQSQEALKGS